MGKAVPRGVKSRANELIKLYKESLSSNFEKNKKFIEAFDFGFSKKTRNLIIGYVTRKIKESQKS